MYCLVVMPYATYLLPLGEASTLAPTFVDASVLSQCNIVRRSSSLCEMRIAG